MALSDREISELLNIKPGEKILDVGGSARQHDEIEVDTILDLKRPEETPYWQSKIKAKNFVQLDLTRDKFPFKDKQFDVCLCTHTLEDLPWPFLAIEEMSRVAKRGYIATPARGLDMTFRRYDLTDWKLGGVRQPGLSHHHWLFELRKGKMYIVAKVYPLLYAPKMQISNWSGDEEFRMAWKNKISYEVFETTNFHEMIAEYKRFLAANKKNLTLGTVAVFWDNPLFMLRELVKLGLGGRGGRNLF